MGESTPLLQDEAAGNCRVSGRQVRTLADRRMEPGQIALSWDGRDGGGRGVGSGIYFHRRGRVSSRRSAS